MWVHFTKPHYHVDARFVPKRLAARVERYYLDRSFEEITQMKPLARLEHSGGAFSGVDVPAHLPPLKPFRCVRQVEAYHFGHSDRVQELRAKFGCNAEHGASPVRRPGGRVLCPHRKADLSQFEPDALGIVTCPLHGLRVQVGAA